MGRPSSPELKPRRCRHSVFGLEVLIQILPVLLLLALGFSVGGFVERAHIKRLNERESEMRAMLVTDLRRIPAGASTDSSGLVTGEVVIASDYFKTFMAKLKGLFGGELPTFQSLLTRARREAVVRMMDRARAMGANRVINVRFETSNIGVMQRKRAAAMVEVYAYGTAVHVPDREKDQWQRLKDIAPKGPNDEARSSDVPSARLSAKPAAVREN